MAGKRSAVIHAKFSLVSSTTAGWPRSWEVVIHAEYFFPAPPIAGCNPRGIFPRSHLINGLALPKWPLFKGFGGPKDIYEISSSLQPCAKPIPGAGRCNPLGMFPSLQLAPRSPLPLCCCNPRGIFPSLQRALAAEFRAVAVIHAEFSLVSSRPPPSNSDYISWPH